LSNNQTFVISNKRGLHARAAAKFVKCIDAFDADIQVFKDDIQVSGRSIMGLMMLSASTGTSIFVTAKGPDAEEAISALNVLISNKFDEE
jgi:phosphocarrier protein HPr